MKMINRNSINDAQALFEKFLPEESNRHKIISFLINAINYANSLNSQQWNLNLDKNGQYIQFNTGCQYCIQIKKDELLILCDKTILKPITNIFDMPIEYRGHIGRKKVLSTNIDDVPDCLSHTPNSVGCLVQLNEVQQYIDFLEHGNKAFIKKAIKTSMTPQMRKAHSQGAIEYLEWYQQNVLLQNSNGIISIESYRKDEEQKITESQKLSEQQRHSYLKNANPKPQKTMAVQSVFIRNIYVIAEVLKRANGICERCHQPAPFLRDSDNSPYLEVHHKQPLAENGEDTIENAIALCPNCHRQAHYGKNSY